jgi:hypothetical protein
MFRPFLARAPAPRFFRQLLHQAASMVAMSIFVIGIIASGDSPFF